jgi:hypothetical protein
VEVVCWSYIKYVLRLTAAYWFFIQAAQQDESGKLNENVHCNFL